MSNTREKLFELLNYIDGKCPKPGHCRDCEYYELDDCSTLAKLDFMIANGVVIQKQPEWTEQKISNGKFYDCCPECGEVKPWMNTMKELSSRNFCPKCGTQMMEQGDSN